jgi:lipopolysaccharide assembly outer membrane protein LptD (OstA)
MKTYTLRPALAAALMVFGSLASGWAASREVKLKSDTLDYDEKKKMVRMLGHVNISSANITITSPYAEFFSETKIAEFQGGVKCVGPGTTATGQRMKAFYNAQHGILTGACRIVSDKGPGAKAGLPTTLWCDTIDYFWNQGLGKAKGSVRVKQGTRRAYGDRATYHKNEQFIVLEGNVRFEQAKDDWLSCEKARMDLASDTVVAEGGVVGRTMTADDKPTGSPTPMAEKSQAKPTVIEPAYPMKAVEADPQILLPGLDDRPAPGKPAP